MGVTKCPTQACTIPVSGSAGKVVEGVVNGVEEAGGLVGLGAKGIVAVVETAGAGVNNTDGGLVGTA